MNKFKSFLIKVLGGEIKTKGSQKKSTTGDPLTLLETSMLESDSLSENYLFDFRNYASISGSSGSVSLTTFNPTDFTPVNIGDNEASSLIENKLPKLKVKPVDVLKELEKVVTPFSLNNLDDKISILKDKEKLISQKYSRREVSALIERLENRKVYSENRDFFDNFQNTTDEYIEKLLSKYQLVMKTADIFIPEFPDEAVKVMKDYTEKTETLFNKKPVFYVIAEEQLFKKAWDRRDPILLVQSPFGFFWQILGAWDKEMLLLSEL